MRHLLVLVLGATTAFAETTLVVDPSAGNNTFTAVFDAAVGERITAVSSDVGCSLHVDEQARTGRATCSVPLAAIRVDNDDTKTDHFRQWATNKAGDADRCAVELDVPRVALASAIEALQPVPFETEGVFAICGRTRDDRGPERISATVTYVPPAADGGVRTLRIRAKIEGFDRERYRVGPRWTPGWLPRVQQLAPVVATSGTIEVTLFATDRPAAR